MQVAGAVGSLTPLRGSLRRGLPLLYETPLPSPVRIGGKGLQPRRGKS